MFIDVSKFDIITSKIEWKIYNLNELKDYMDNEQFLSSKEFYNTNCPSIVWEMRLYPNLSICRRGGPRYSMSTAVSLFKKGGVDNELKVKYKIYAINADLKNVNITLDGFDSFPKNNNESTRNQIELESLLHSDGSILLYCEVNLALCEKNLINNRMTFNIPRKPFIDMYKQGILTDCVIKIGNEKINAHRCVLANNSEVFRKMFEQKDMLEAKNGEVNIIDSSPECVRTMIEYFYNGEINKEILEMLAHELFVIAHKYEIISLMDICEHIMASKVDANSFAENLKYIHIYNLPILEKACVTFITTNRMTFLDSKEWKDLKQLYKDKAIDLLEAAFKNC